MLAADCSCDCSYNWSEGPQGKFQLEARPGFRLSGRFWVVSDRNLRNKKEFESVSSAVSAGSGEQVLRNGGLEWSTECTDREGVYRERRKRVFTQQVQVPCLQKDGKQTRFREGVGRVQNSPRVSGRKLALSQPI